MIRAVLFDMDGVLFDTETLGMHAMETIAAELGYHADRAFYMTTLGVPNAECEHIYREGLGQDFPYELAMQRFRAYFSEYNLNHPMPRKDGLMECLAGLKSRGLKIVLATSTVRPLVEAYFAKMTDIAVLFDGKVCGGDVPNGKPAPDTYLAAAAVAGCSPEECIGVEDSYSGVRSVRGSGARCVMVPDLLPFSERFQPYVDHVLDSLWELCPLIDRLNVAE